MLNEPLTLACGRTLPNRLAKAAMTEGLAPAGDPTATLCGLYRAWGDSGAGLLLTGNVMVDRRYLERLGNVVFDARTDRAAVRRWADAAHAGGAAVFAQLSHPGRQTNRFVHGRPVAPSAVPAVRVMQAFGRPRALTTTEIDELIERFASAAGLAHAQGFDGVQLHAAHGYLLAQFLSPATNLRDDRWGASVAGRAAVLVEAVRRVRARVGSGFGVAVKLNASDFQRGGFGADDAIEVLRLLEAEGVDFVELSGGTYESTAMMGHAAEPEGASSLREGEAYFLGFARRARAETRLRLMLTGGIRSRRTLDGVLAAGVELVGLARPFCAQPRVGHALLAGDDAALRPVEIPAVGLRPLQAQAETDWCQAQMQRIARGEAPDLALGVRALAARNLVRHMVEGPARRLFGRTEAPPATLPDGPQQHPTRLLARFLQDPQSLVEECRAQYGDTFTLRMSFLPPLVVVSHPDDIRDLFTASAGELSAADANELLRPFLGSRSLPLLDGPEHMRQRKLLLPPFHGERMQTYGQLMLDFAEATVASWPRGEAFTLRPSMQSLTLQVILRSVFGLEEGPLFKPAADLVARALDAAVWPPLLLPAVQRDLGPWSPWGRYLRLADETYAVVLEQIRRRRAEGTAGRPDVLSLLIDARDEAGEPLSDLELRDHLVTLLVVGHDTTATALAWTFHYLLTYPEVTRKLVAELDAAGPLTPERIAALPYLDAVVREGLRINPVVPLVGRRLTAARRIGGHELPAGTALQLAIYLTSRREETFAHADRFEPERFLDRKFTPSEWYPFGGGVRRCIGMAFAIYEMKMVLATVLTRVTLTRADESPVRAVRRSITLTPSDDVRVVARARVDRATARA